MKTLERQPDDASLMARIASGDEDAFRMLVERYYASVYRLACRHLGSVADAEDATQDTFQRVFAAASRYRPEGSFRTYLFTIAARLCLNRKQRHDRSRTTELEPGVLDSTPASSASQPDVAAEQKERDAAIRRALDGLPADQRLAILLLRYQEASCEEIARILNRSPAAVHSLLYRARGRLAELLQGTPSSSGR